MPTTKPRQRATSSRLGTFTAFAGAQVVAIALLFGPLAGQRWWGGFRAYFSNDQLSYAAIATSVSQGQFGFVEPFTLTGVSHYPSAWYYVVGLASAATHQPVWVMWQVLGALMVMAAVAVVGWTALRLSGRAWAPVLPGLALLTGTLALPLHGDWMAVLGHHAVLWGPYGSLFTLNGEVIGLSIAAIALCLLLLAGTTRRHWLVIVSASLIGVIANVQTYSFLAASFLAALLVSVASVLRHRAWRLGAVSTVLAVITVALGPVIAGAFGPLPLFALLVACLAPAAWPLVRGHVRLAMASLAALAALAAPQVLRTLMGIAEKDPFLLYRQESSLDLGVPLGPALLAALPLVLVGIACAVVVCRREQHVLAALLLSLPIASLVMSTNDIWGFNQEPYRFWLQYEILGALLLAPVLAWSIANWRQTPGIRKRVATIAAVLALTVWAVSLADFPSWWRFAGDQGLISATDARATALESLLDGREGLVMSSHCIDPQLVKLVRGGQVAHYNAGLAWPPVESDFKIFQDPGRRAGEDYQALSAADVAWVVTDSACQDDWSFGRSGQVVKVGSLGYEDAGATAELSLWSVQH